MILAFQGQHLGPRQSGITNPAHARQGDDDILDARPHGTGQRNGLPIEKPLFKMVVMVSSNKTPQEVGMTRKQARKLIDDKMVPTGLYPSVLAVALS